MILRLATLLTALNMQLAKVLVIGLIRHEIKIYCIPRQEEMNPDHLEFLVLKV
jgi:hypothetical protein